MKYTDYKFDIDAQKKAIASAQKDAQKFIRENICTGGKTVQDQEKGW